MIINFESAKSLEEHIDSLQQEIEALYPDAYIKLKRYNIMYKKYPIEALFTGPDPAVLHQLADSARAIMDNSPVVTMTTTDWEPAMPVLDIDYNQTAARRSSLSRQDIAASVLTAAGGIPIGYFYEGIHKNTIYIKCVEPDGSKLDNLEKHNEYGEHKYNP